jgi:uncharacterized protein (DUF305 family)
MILFSRSFIRKRVISLATTAAVAATSLALAQNRMRPSHSHGAMPVQYVANPLDYSAEQRPLAENAAALNRTMAEIAVKPTGDTDRDFVAMMVAHHQSVVDMAKAELRYGHNEQLRCLAQQIIVAEGQQITLMRRAIGEKLSAASPAQPGSMVSSMTPDDATARGSMTMN